MMTRRPLSKFHEPCLSKTAATPKIQSLIRYLDNLYGGTAVKGKNTEIGAHIQPALKEYRRNRKKDTRI